MKNLPIKTLAHCKTTLIASVLLLMAACASTPGVGTDFDPEFQFSTVKKVAVMRPNAMLSRAGGQAGSGVNDLTASRLTRYITDALEARGFIVVPADEADLIATFFVNTESKTDVRSYNASVSYGRCWNMRYCANWGTPDVRVDEYQEGTLLIDMVEPAAGELKWRGTSSERLPSKMPSAEEREAIGRALVGRILDQFPPS